MKKQVAFILCIGVCLVYSFFKLDHWGNNISRGDSWGYISYLPATFIYHDLGNYTQTVDATRVHAPEFPDPLSDKYGLYKQHPVTGKMVVKYTSGVATLLAPFFFIVHAFISTTGGLADGYSEPYCLALGLGVICWVLIGLYFLTILLRRYFSKEVTIVTILTLVFATNLFYNTTLNSIMSHGLLFSLYSIYIFCIDTYYRNPTWKRIIVIGCITGLITLVRMNECYCILILLLWDIKSKEEFVQRFVFIWQNIKQFLVAALATIIVFIPQIIYWKKYTNSWIYNGYVGEGFDFAHPHIIDGLFSFNNGWLSWTPIMILACIGIYFSYKRMRTSFLATVVLVPLHIYIIYAWWCWNYINGFGSRPMEHMYPLLAFSLATYIALFEYQRWFGKLFIGILIGSAICINLFQNYQITKGVLITQASNFAYYFSVFGKTKSDHNILVSRSSNEIQPNNPVFIQNLKTLDFEDEPIRPYVDAIRPKTGKYSLHTDEQSIYLDTISMTNLNREAKYIQLASDVFFEANHSPNV